MLWQKMEIHNREPCHICSISSGRLPNLLGLCHHLTKWSLIVLGRWHLKIKLTQILHISIGQSGTISRHGNLYYPRILSYLQSYNPKHEKGLVLHLYLQPSLWEEKFNITSYNFFRIQLSKKSFTIQML